MSEKRRSGRMEREAQTVTAMIHLYCEREHHTPKGELCPECSALLDYVLLRLERCPFQEGKTTCANCPVHCYRPDRRAQIRLVMRTAGPAMLYHHPLMTLRHWLDGFRKEPIRAPRRKKADGSS